jgi:hypothetical protein
MRKSREKTGKLFLQELSELTGIYSPIHKGYDKVRPIVMKPKSHNREVREIWDKLAYIGRYTDGISPKLQKYQELQIEKEKLRKRLKEIKKENNMQLY